MAVMAEHLPQVWRMAVNLAGSEQRGREVVRRVMEQAQPAMETWERLDEPPRWFRHHTILALRQLGDPPFDPEHDPLVQHAPPTLAKAAAYRAMVAALRKRPHQQREAFLLHHGENFDARQLGIAMDCSVEAAGVHLKGAAEALHPLAGSEYPQLLKAMREAYAQATPPANVAVRYKRRWVSRPWRRRLVAAGLFIGWAMLLAIVGAIVVAVWFLKDRVEI